jgi:hypothetical protein
VICSVLQAPGNSIRHPGSTANFDVERPTPGECDSQATGDGDSPTTGSTNTGEGDSPATGESDDYCPTTSSTTTSEGDSQATVEDDRSATGEGDSPVTGEGDSPATGDGASTTTSEGASVSDKYVFFRYLTRGLNPWGKSAAGKRSTGTV